MSSSKEDSIALFSKTRVKSYLIRMIMIIVIIILLVMVLILKGYANLCEEDEDEYDPINDIILL